MGWPVLVILLLVWIIRLADAYLQGGVFLW